MSNLNATGGGLRYRGTNAPQPPNCNFHPRDPNDFDRFGYSLLDMWLNTVTQTPWWLVALEGTSSSGGIRATWVTFGGASAGVINTKGNDGVAVFPDVSGNLNIIGTDPLFVTGTPGTNTETITVATATTAQIGVTTLATNALTIAGASTTTVNTPASLKAKLGAQTLNGLPYGQGQTAAIAWTAAGTNGQVPIAATGGAPAFATLTSSDGSITFATSPNGLDLTAAIAGGSSIITTVYDTPGTYAFTKNTATKKIEIWGWAGGGGGSGTGASGAAGDAFHYSFPAFFVDDGPTTIPVVVGAGGAGGVGVSGLGVAGGPSWFGNFTTGHNLGSAARATGINSLAASPTVVTEGSNAWPGDLSTTFTIGGITGTDDGILSGFPGRPSPFGAITRNADDGVNSGTGSVNNVLGSMLGGAGGGGGSSSTSAPAGGSGGGIRNRRTISLIASGGAGGAVGIAGSPGTDTYPAPAGFNFLSGGTGGGGGGSGATGTGGAGGFPGGGGGGAGAGATGGAGGDGLVIVMEFLSD
jgi:hypothetical protein